MLTNYLITKILNKISVRITWNEEGDWLKFKKEAVDNFQYF